MNEENKYQISTKNRLTENLQDSNQTVFLSCVKR